MYKNIRSGTIAYGLFLQTSVNNEAISREAHSHCRRDKSEKEVLGMRKRCYELKQAAHNRPHYDATRYD